MDDIAAVLARSEFHDSELAEIDWVGSEISLVFSNVSISLDDQYYRVTVRLVGVTRVELDGRPVSELAHSGRGSSVINFRRSEGYASMLVEWFEYQPRRTELALYEFRYRLVTQTAQEQEEFDLS